MKCKKHPKYQAKLPPRCLCEECWRIWIKKQNAIDYKEYKDYFAYDTPIGDVKLLK